LENFYLVNTNNFHYYDHGLKVNMAACVRLPAALLLVLAVLVLYGDLALHIQPEQPQP
jgi:hypothetical protein